MKRTFSLSLILFGLMVLLALSTVWAKEKEGNSLSEELAVPRVVRSPEAGKQMKRKNGKDNKKAVEDAQAKVKSLSGSTKFRRSAPAASCSEVVTIATSLTDLAKSFPTSPKVPGLSGQITSSSASLTCTENEKTSLKGLDSKFQAALTEITKALTEAQKELGLTDSGVKINR